MSRNSTDESASGNKRNRGRYLSCWVSNELFDQVCADADRAGLTRSDYMKQVLGGAPVPRKFRVPRTARVELGRFIGMLGRLSNNMNQYAKQANIAGKLGRWETMPALIAHAELIKETQTLLEEILATLYAVQHQPVNVVSDGKLNRVTNGQAGMNTASDVATAEVEDTEVKIAEDVA